MSLCAALLCLPLLLALAGSAVAEPFPQLRWRSIGPFRGGRVLAVAMNGGKTSQRVAPLTSIPAAALAAVGPEAR
jgi:hypothetical protein